MFGMFWYIYKDIQNIIWERPIDSNWPPSKAEKIKNNDPNISKDIPDIQSKIALLGKAILKLKKKSIANSILIPDIFSAFIIIYYKIL